MNTRCFDPSWVRHIPWTERVTGKRPGRNLCRKPKKCLKIHPQFLGYWLETLPENNILLMEEILHHLRYLKTPLWNNEIIYQPQLGDCRISSINSSRPPIFMGEKPLRSRGTSKSKTTSGNSAAGEVQVVRLKDQGRHGSMFQGTPLQQRTTPQKDAIIHGNKLRTILCMSKTFDFEDFRNDKGKVQKRFSNQKKQGKISNLTSLDMESFQRPNSSTRGFTWSLGP